MKKGTLALIIIVVLLFAATAVLGYLFYNSNSELNKFKKNEEMFEEQVGDYENQLAEYEEQVEELTNQIAVVNEINANVNEIQGETADGQTNQTGNVNGKKYEIVTNIPAEVKYNKETEGAELIQNNGYYYAIIKMGTKNTGGYSLTITNVEINGENVKIYVKKTEPAAGQTVTTALTYPVAAVRFNFEPKAEVVYQ